MTDFSLAPTAGNDRLEGRERGDGALTEEGASREPFMINNFAVSIISIHGLPSLPRQPLSRFGSCRGSQKTCQ
jgi:hypothetical protein